MDPVVVVILRAALALLLAAAAVHKLRDAGAFRASVAAYALLPDAAVGAFSRVLPALEVAIALALLGPATGHAGALAAAALLAVYALAIGINLARGRRDLDCGCFGVSSRQTIGGALLARNALLIAAALATLAPARVRPLAWLDYCTASLALATLAALYAAADRLLAHGPALARLRAEGRA
ncbi:MAG: MauE/DoxX family redox-associated membrane protein [Thermodesulfobacteriota bacterium]